MNGTFYQESHQDKLILIKQINRIFFVSGSRTSVVTIKKKSYDLTLFQKMTTQEHWIKQEEEIKN